MTIEISCRRATLAPDVHKKRYTYIEARSYFRVKSNKTIFQNKIIQNTSPEQSCATFLFKIGKKCDNSINKRSTYRSINFF